MLINVLGGPGPYWFLISNSICNNMKIHFHAFRSLIFQTSTFPRKPTSVPSTETKVKQNSGTQKSPSVMAKSENNKKSRESGGGGGGIPRPQLGITTSPSKLAVRTHTSKMVTMGTSVTNPASSTGISSSSTSTNTNHNNNNSNKHEQIVRSASGGGPSDSKHDTGPYKLIPPSISYSANNSNVNRALVNDKLYPRIPNPGPPLFHPSAPQRSQTLSMIPSHSSRTKMGAGNIGGPQIKVWDENWLSSECHCK